jgi:GTP-binding protein HflX
MQILLTDTVGFIKNLPHHLIKAFKSTLDETRYADVIVLICDLSDGEYETQLSVAATIFDDMDIKNKPILKVYNKSDAADPELVAALKSRGELCVSAKTGDGMDNLLAGIRRTLEQDRFELDFIFPIGEQGSVASLYRSANVLDAQYDETSVAVRAIVNAQTRGALAGFIAKGGEKW